MIEVIVWSAKHDPASPVKKALLRRAQTDSESLLKEMREAARK